VVFGKEQHAFRWWLGVKTNKRRTAMEPHQQRVVREKDELDAKIASLIAFIVSDNFNGICESERKRMRRQEVLMELYSEVLAERIAAFK